MMATPRRALGAVAALLIIVVAAATIRGAHAQQQQQQQPASSGGVDSRARRQSPTTVASVLADAFNPATLARGATNLVLGLTAAPPPGNVADLPQCAKSNLLLNSGGWPAGFGRLPAQQQAESPINLVMVQLAYAAYRPVDELRECLGALGASDVRAVSAPVPEYRTTRHALLVRAGTERIFLLLRGSEATDAIINLACRHEALPGGGAAFGAAGLDAKLARGVALGWQALEAPVLAELKDMLRAAPKAEVVVAGHSLGAALSAVAALRLNTLLAGRAAGAPSPSSSSPSSPSSSSPIAGVFMFASPRAGNAQFARLYDRVLGSKTLRFSNYQDFAVDLPEQRQRCSVEGASLTAATAPFDFSHVGRAVQLCPDARTGAVRLSVHERGSEQPACNEGAVDASAATHQLGSYADALRRALGRAAAADPRTRALSCAACSRAAATRLLQVAVPVRPPGGPVTCGVEAQCTLRAPFEAASDVGGGSPLTRFNVNMRCVGFVCVAE